MGHFIDSTGAFKIKYVDPRGAFNPLRRGILLSPSGHLKLNMLTPAAHLIHSDGVSVGAFKIKYVDPRSEFNSLRRGILLTPLGHLKLNMLTPAEHLIHSDGAFY